MAPAGTGYRVAVFAATYAALRTGHEVGDMWAQSNTQAVDKGKPGRLGRYACAGHVATLTATKALTLAATTRALGIRLDWRYTAAAMVVDAASHYVIDRRAPLRKLAALLQPVNGKLDFYDLGDDMAAPCGTGKYALDQSAHAVMLWVTALIIAGGGRRG